LIAIEDQTEILIKDAGPRTLARIKAVIADSENADFVSMGKPRTTLERLFLDEAKKSQANTMTTEQKGGGHA
jgi:ABC-2 type transport system ATP-binding protein